MGDDTLVHTGRFAHPLRTARQRDSDVLDEIQEILCRHASTQAETGIPRPGSTDLHTCSGNETELDDDSPADLHDLHNNEPGNLPVLQKIIQ